MSQITEAKITYKTPAGFEHKSAQVELKVLLYPGEDVGAQLDDAFDIADRSANRAGGFKSTAPKKQAVTQPAPQPEPPARTKADLAKELGIEDAVDVVVEEEKPKKRGRGRPPKKKPTPVAKEEDASGMSEFDVAAEEVEAEVEDETAEVEEVTDKDLNAAAQVASESIGPDQVKGLISKRSPDKSKKFTLRQIPQEDRSQFLTDLDRLVENLGKKE